MMTSAQSLMYYVDLLRSGELTERQFRVCMGAARHWAEYIIEGN